MAGYGGQTALKTQEVIEKAMGGMLFIDEAYALVQDESGVDYGHEAVAALIKAMEDYRGKFCVILAGYRIPMEKMIASNPGFASRIQFTLQFPDYTRNELKQISQLMLQSRNYAISETAMDKLLDITDFKRKEPNFANAREVRSLLEQIIMSQSLRTVGTNDRELTLADVNAYIRDAKLSLPVSDSTSKRILSAEEELEQLIGLTAVKRMIRKIRAYAVRNQNDSNFNLHMCFYGNPGTGKTEVARLLSRILYDAGILSEAKCIETDAHGLIGRYVGETAPKTRSKIEEAMGGVLFIDEAYSLTESDGHYGDEAISVLLKEMEDNRGQFCVVLAGYKEKMQQMLRTNPGMTSRIPFTLDFPDYSQDELREIAILLLDTKGYQIEDAALELVLDICKYERSGNDYANARTLRNILDQVLLNQNLRTEHSVGDNSILRTDVEEYIQDEQIDLNRSSKQPGKIGFS
ncbi:MAG: AAA family ATPase [Oscillospiraceae bacterium]|nr:AAA family ATPase [Oscillospiraceae bacterium]MBR3418407.1 AAA family ATPase [Oscillospiraceae bacterium]